MRHYISQSTKLLLIITLFLGLFAFTFSNTSKKELFKGENLLSECFHYIPLTYKKKHDAVVAKKASELKEKD